MCKIIEAKHIFHTYLPGSVYAQKSLQDIDFSLNRGEVLGILGSNGSGKSTLIQHCNGLIKPTRGTMTVCGIDTAHPKAKKKLWRRVGLVFQYPEQQIFQTNVYDEVAYGPRNLGLPETRVQKRVAQAMHQVGLDLAKTARSAPMTLSGGMRRRIAIAGILAIKPELLILDEPLAGLDARGRQLIIDLIKRRRDQKETTVIVSHKLKEIITVTDKIAVLSQGAMVFFGHWRQLLYKPEMLDRYSDQLPEFLQVVASLAAQGVSVNTDVRNMQETAAAIMDLLKCAKE